MKKTILLTIALVLFGAAFVTAQDDTVEVKLRITSVPPGVTVHLEGAYQLTTTTPADITQELTGTYSVKAEKFGYETWKSYLTMLPDQPASLRIRLTPKTRIKAGLRSAILPGWGQFYSGRKGWGYFFAAGSLTLAAGYVLADLNYSNKYDDFVDVRNEFDAATSIEQKIALKQKMDDRQREAYDAQNLRNVALGLAIGLWAYNVVDNVFFFPSAQSGVFERLSTSYDVQSGQVSLKYIHPLGL